MKKYITTGLAILLPVLVTCLIVGFFINFVTRPFVAPTVHYLSTLSRQYDALYFLQQKDLLIFSSKLLILLLLGGIVFIVGLIANIFFVEYLIQWGNYIFYRVPIVNKIYRACQDVVHSVFHTSTSFSKVVLVPFPTEKSLSIGFITGNPIELVKKGLKDSYVSVFVPGTPNPSVGFLILLNAEKLMHLNMKVDEAMKFVLSCGVVS